MKLKNKKTGEIMEFDAILPVKDVVGDSVAHLEYGSLAELNEEWEDYEEPKEYWYVNDLDGKPMKCELRYCPTSINNGNIHWKRYASKLFPENKIFQLQDVDVSTGFVKNKGIKTFYTRVNGELCHQNTWEIIKRTKPKVFMVENPDNYSWDYIHKYIAGGIPKIYMNNLVYSAYEPERFSPKKEIFGSNIKLKLKDYGIYKNGNSIKGSCDKNGFISKDYGTRSKIPELALKDFFDQAIQYIEGKNEN